MTREGEVDVTITTGALARRSRDGDVWTFLAIGLGAGLVAVAFAVLVPDSLAYVVGVPVLVVGTLAVLRDWRIGLILAAASMPLAGVAAPGTSASVFRVIAAVTTLSVGLRLASSTSLRERLTRLVRSRLVVVLGAYLGWMSLSVLWASRSDLWATQVVAAAGFALLALLVGLADRRTIGWIWVAVLVGSVVAIPLASTFQGSTEYITGFRRLSIGGGDPNEMAMLLAVAIGVALARNYDKPEGRVLSVAAILLLGAAIVLTGSRSGTAALLAVLAGSVLVAVFKHRGDAGGPKPAQAGRTVAAWAAGVVLFLVVASLVTDRVDLGLDVEELAEAGSARISTLAQFSDGVDLSGRELIWPVMLTSVSDHPILGVGAGNAEVVSLEAGVYRSEGSRGAGTHSTLLQTLVEGGLVGAALYLAVWIAAIGYVVSLWRRGEPLAGPLALGVLAWATAGLVLNLHDDKVAALLLGSILALWLSDSILPSRKASAA